MLSELKITNFAGPLDLLWQLLEVNGYDIKDIPIASITEQYVAVLHRDLKSLDPELASEFLIMASTLMQLKSQILLPRNETDDGETDPREELTLRLLRYRRNKMIAQMLEERRNQFGGCIIRQPATPAELGIDIEIIEDKPSARKFLRAVNNIVRRNKERFSDRQQRLRQLLQRETFSVREKINYVLQRLSAVKLLRFNEIFPPSTMVKAERIAGFLAILEMVKTQKILAKQPRPFAEIIVRKSDE